MNMAPRLINKFLSATAAERFHFRSIVSSVRYSSHERLLMGYGKLAHLINLVRIIDTYYGTVHLVKHTLAVSRKIYMPILL